MMAAEKTSETLVNFYQTTRCYNPEDSNLHTHRRENLKSYSPRIMFTVLHFGRIISKSIVFTSFFSHLSELYEILSFAKKTFLSDFLIGKVEGRLIFGLIR
jgi:hypothetical protein